MRVMLEALSRPRADTRRAHLRSLQKSVERKRQELQQLQAEHDRLHRRHALLLGLYDSLEWMCDFSGWEVDNAAVQELLQQLEGVQYAGVPAPAAAEAAAAAAAAGGAATRKRAAAGGEARGRPRRRGARQAAPAHSAPSLGEQQLSAAAPADEFICPPDDPFLTWRYQVAQPVDPRAETITMAEILSEFRRTVGTIAIALQRLDAGMPQAAAAAASAASASLDPGDAAAWLSVGQPLEEIKHGAFAFIGLLRSLTICGRDDMVFRLHVTNTDTGQELQPHQLPSPARYLQLVRSLQLSDDQLQRLAVGHEVFGKLRAPLLATWRQLQQDSQQQQQQQQQQQDQEQTAGSHQHAQQDRGAEATLPAAAANGDPSGSLMLAQLDVGGSWATKAHLAMAKGTLLNDIYVNYVHGCLTCRQLARAVVFLAPCTCRPLFLCEAATELLRERQARPGALQRPPL